MIRKPLALLLLVALWTAAGCGSTRRETTPLSGKVTLAGQPVTSGRIIFWPDDGGPSAGGAIEADGSYQLTTFSKGDGAVLGRHKVTIEASNIIQGADAPRSMNDEMRNTEMYRKPPVKVENLVPPRYAGRETSGLTAEVTKGVGPINFGLVREH